MPFVLDNAEQVDLTDDEAAHLTKLGLIYQAEPDNPAYFTTPWNVSLGAVEAVLTTYRQELT